MTRSLYELENGRNPESTGQHATQFIS